LIFFLRSEGFSDFTGLCGIITNDFLTCTRRILTSEKSESWANNKALSGRIDSSGLNLDQNEYQRVPNLTYADFDYCLKSFQMDLKTISEIQKIKIVLLIDEAQVMLFFFFNLIVFSY